ncbi:MAG: efflux RND transporter periplasmic adaptor subunit [Bacteroidota bacterium]|nr:efflux RND transporter periplasmic adaptor subunit [Bacteroidota bacterium]
MKKIFLLTMTILSFVSCNRKTNVESSTDPLVVLNEATKTESSGDLHYSGSIEAYQTIPLAFQTSGTVLRVLVNASDAVHKGQLLATVDKADAQSMYEMSNSKYLQAKDAYDRLKEVHDNGSLSEIKWIEMESNLQQAKSSVAIAKNNLKKTSLYSPDDGIIGKRNIEPGMSSLSGTIVPLELIKIGSVYVKIAVPENEIGKIKKGLRANFKVSALDDKIFNGIVTNVGVVADQISRTYEVKITVKNPGLLLKPGMVCDVNLGITATKELLTIPYQAVDKDLNNNNFVFVVDPAQKIAKKRIIHIGNYVNDNIEILDGLSVGEKVVCEGKQKLSDNCKVTF